MECHPTVICGDQFYVIFYFKVLVIQEEEQNLYWHVGLYTFVITAPWGWHISAETFYTIEEYLSLLWIKNGIIRSYYSSILIFSSII